MKSALVTCIALVLVIEARRAEFYRTYKCTESGCQKTARPIKIIDQEDLKTKEEHTSIAACRLVCEKAGGLWPIPTGIISTGNNYLNVHPSEFHFDLKEAARSVRSFISEVFSIFVNNLQATCRHNCTKSNSTVTVHVKVESSSLDLNWDTDEKYSLNVTTKGSKVTVVISAVTVYGARHGFETLSQLTAPVRTSDGALGLVLLNSAMIKDQPIFPHRGLLIDTARNFLSVSTILRTIDGLASTKMNVLHWHATDSQSFPLEIKSRPSMAFFGSYAPDKVYSVEHMALVVRYAKVRGVRVILELDSPAHAGAGWEWGESAGYGKLAVCVNEQPWRQFCIQPPCGQLNPVNSNTYDVLRNIYKDILNIWGSNSVLHLGGDEVYLPCWNSTPEITTVMKERGMKLEVDDFLQLWGEFHSLQLNILDNERQSNNVSAILWSSYLTGPNVVERYLDKTRFVIQTWVETSSDLPSQLLNLGYRVIMSTKNAWYLDHGFWGTTKYHTWRDAYNNRLPRMLGILGGEACMWGEYVDNGGFDSRVWPRTAAVAERLWSDPFHVSTADAEPRLQGHRERLAARRIYSEAITPEWCTQYERQCL